MKPLKEFLTESIFDILDNADKSIVEDIEDFIKNNYKVTGGKLEIEVVDDKYIVNCRGTVDVINYGIESLTNEFFKWGVVLGSFNCQNCRHLKSLEGSPEEVGKNFLCDYCTEIKDLTGAPNYVKGNFYCTFCKALKSFEGDLKRVDGKFYCHNSKATTGFDRKGIIKKIKSNIKIKGEVFL